VNADHYAVLELDRNTASPTDVKRAYRRISKVWHPDKNPTDKKRAEEEMMRINNAYEILSDPLQKDTYDSSLKMKEASGSSNGRYSHEDAEAYADSTWEEERVDYLYEVDEVIRLDRTNHLHITRLNRGSTVWLLQFYRHQPYYNCALTLSSTLSHVLVNP